MIFINATLLKKQTFKEIKDLIQFGASIIDVRSAEDFREDHISTAMNILLNEVVNRIDEFKSIKQPFLYA